MDVREIKEKIRTSFAEKKRSAEYAADERLDYARSINAQFDELKRQEGALKCQIGKSMAFGEDCAKQLAALEENAAQQTKVLKKMGMSQQDFLSQYSCPVCKDTGYVNGKECACFQAALGEELVKNCGITDTQASLGSFKPKSDSQKIVAKTLKNFLDKADTTKVKNVLLWGPTGTGKTYMLTCLANDMRKIPMGVLFMSAVTFNDLLLKIHLAPLAEKASVKQSVISPDVLVVDDLGSEPFRKNVTEQYFLSVLDERMSAGKFTLVSTNLGKDDLLDRYGDRVFSRLVSDTSVIIKLDGSDLRLTKL